MKRACMYLLLGIFILANCNLIWASVETDVEKANKAGKPVFLVVTEPGIAGIEEALRVANQAHKSAPKSTVIEMNRADAANKDLVAKYRLAGAPLPVFLVIVSDGMVAGGLRADRATAEILVNMIPSPQKTETIRALTEGKAIFIVASRESMLDRTGVFETCEAACTQMKDRAAFVAIDMDDKEESSFLTELKVSPVSTEPIIMVINTQGQMTATFNGQVESKTLIQAATKRVASGCCPPGGSQKGCN